MITDEEQKCSSLVTTRLSFLKAKQTRLYFTFQRCSFEKNIATVVIMTNKYS